MLMNTLFRSPDKAAEKGQGYADPLRVAVVGACRDAGASFVSGQILKNGLLEGRTPEGLRTLCELGTPYFYTALGFDKRFAGRKFYGFSSHGKHELNTEMGYNWYVRMPDELSLDSGLIFKSFYSASGSMVVYDCSGLSGEDVLFDVLDGADIVYLVIDPLPTRLIGSQRFTEKLRESFPGTQLVVNKFAKGIHRGELAAFLGTSAYHKVDFFPAERIYRAEYNCLLP